MTLVRVEEFGSVIEAISREKQLKRWSRAKKKALIDGDIERLRQLSKARMVRQAHHDI
jgi:putative endonuclease